jgi:uncharacterized protein (TIGR02246 family)
MRIGPVCFAALSGLLFSCAGGLYGQDATAPKDPARDADREAILQSGRDFKAAFEKGDAKAVAALWTEQGEYESEDGEVLRGRAAIEAAFAAHFKASPAGKSEVKVDSIRFPSRDTAIEEGLTCALAGGGLPDSSRYRVVHVREDGKWQIALCREWGANECRMIDLDWLIGSWHGESKERTLDITFSHDENAPFVIGKFSNVVDGKQVPMGTMVIGVDPATRQFMSWHYDQDGGYGHGRWLRERNHWVVDSNGVKGDGTPIAAVNVLSRIGDNEVGWRTIDRKLGGQALPDAAPIRLSRVTASK